MYKNNWTLPSTQLAQVKSGDVL